MTNNLYNVKNLLEKANTAFKMAEICYEQADVEMGSKLTKTGLEFAIDAENQYADIVGVGLHYKQLFDLFGIN